MNKIRLYVGEIDNSQESETGITIKKEISQEDLTELNTAFEICSLYNSITQIKNIVIENGESFKSYMSPQNLLSIRKHNITPERAITLANKAVLNYASSIKTYIDMEIRLLKKNATETDLIQFNEICHTFYDKNMEYRFWVNFRNYIVHCEFPYSIYQESAEEGCKIVCPKERLLKFDNWKHSKSDIQKMEDEIDLPALVDNMSSLIYALYIDFFRYFANKIVESISTYSKFCKKYDVEIPVIFKMNNSENIENCHFQPLPIKELKDSFDILKSNPRVTINAM